MKRRKDSTGKPIAVFDIDGTIFRSSLLIELNATLVAKGIFPEAAQERVLGLREAWMNRKGSYQNYIDAIVDLYMRDIKGKLAADISKIARDVIAEQRHRVYVFTRDLIANLRSSHRLVIISFSPTEVVDEFKRAYRFQFAKGITYETERGRYTGALSTDTILDKKEILLNLVARYDLSLDGSIGVGDTETDAEFLQLVEHPIAFNPNKKLYETARRNKWAVVVERKDVIYRL